MYHRSVPAFTWTESRETPGLAAAIAGLCRGYRDDEERLARGSVLFESLLAYYAMKKEGRP